MFTKLISIGLLTGSLFLAGLIIFGSSSQPKTITRKEASFQIQNVEFISPSNISEKNSTREIAEKISKEILARNPNGPETFNQQPSLSVPNPKKIVEEYFKNGLANFDINSLKGIVDRSKIITSADAGQEAIVNYFQNFQSIVKNNFQSLQIDFKNLNTSDFDRLARVYNKSIQEFYALAVPKSLLSIHEKEISLLNAELNIFLALRNYKEDPLKALLATEAIMPINKEFAALQKSINATLAKL